MLSSEQQMRAAALALTGLSCCPGAAGAEELDVLRRSSRWNAVFAPRGLLNLHVFQQLTLDGFLLMLALCCSTEPQKYQNSG